MAKVGPFYVWVAPAFFPGSPFDHVWVTNFDNRAEHYADIGAVAQAKKNFWFCWGLYRAVGQTPDHPDGFLGQQSGDLAVAACLVKVNADCHADKAARGTIAHYGIEGVCHQLANQVLYATGQGGAAPLTTSAARTYWLSELVYGPYGTDHAGWTAKVAACMPGAHHSLERSMTRGPKDQIPLHPGELEARARREIADPQKLQDLLALRERAQHPVRTRDLRAAQPTAAEINAQNQKIFDEAAKILGPDEYRRLFGFEPGQKVDLVDPAIRDAAAPPLKAQ